MIADSVRTYPALPAGASIPWWSPMGGDCASVGVSKPNAGAAAVTVALAFQTWMAQHLGMPPHANLTAELVLEAPIDPLDSRTSAAGRQLALKRLFAFESGGDDGDDGRVKAARISQRRSMRQTGNALSRQARQWNGRLRVMQRCRRATARRHRPRRCSAVARPWRLSSPRRHTPWATPPPSQVRALMSWRVSRSRERYARPSGP